MRDGYWESLAGFRHQHRWREARHVLAWIRHEPERKGPRGARSAGAFRRAVRTDSADGGRKLWPQARLALSLDFTTTRKQPPNIERLAKHYLDLLGDHQGDDDGPLLYRDDRQVKMLYVSCHHRWDPDAPSEPGSIHLDCCSRADAIGALEAAYELEVFHDGSTREEDDWVQDERDPSRQFEGARQLEESGDAHLKRMAADIRFDALRAYQESFLQSSDRWLSRLFRSRGRELVTGKPATWEQRIGRRSDSETRLRPQMQWTPTSLQDELRGFFQVPLPGLPAQPGDRAKFKRNLDEACHRFLQAHLSLSPLVVPLRVTILVVPPHGKDLDNLALEVVPLINRHFRPHQEPWLLDGPDVGLPAGLRNRDRERERQLARLRSVGEYSVWAYQVIELHRRPDHPAEGWASVVLGHGENRHSVWGEAEDYVTRQLQQDAW